MDLQAGCGTSSLSEKEVEQVFRQVLMIKFSSYMLHFSQKRDAKHIFFCVLSVTLSSKQGFHSLKQCAVTQQDSVHPEEPALQIGKA